MSAACRRSLVHGPLLLLRYTLGALPWAALLAAGARPQGKGQGQGQGQAGEQPPASAAVALGRLGGLKGGKARARKLTAKQRRASARKAAVARLPAQRREPPLAFQEAW